MTNYAKNGDGTDWCVFYNSRNIGWCSQKLAMEIQWLLRIRIKTVHLNLINMVILDKYLYNNVMYFIMA